MNIKIKEIIYLLKEIQRTTKDEDSNIEMILNNDGVINGNVTWYQDGRNLRCKVTVDTKILDRPETNWINVLLTTILVTIGENHAAIDAAINSYEQR